MVVEEWSARAAAVRTSQDEVHIRYVVRDDGPEQYAAWSESTRRLKADMEALEAPLRDLSRRLRAGDPAAIRPCLDFLLADPYCFRSGYLKAELMHRLANGPALVGRDREDAQAVVLMRVTEPQVRLLRHAARLAVAVWDDGLLRRLQALAVSGDADPLVIGDLLQRVRQQRGPHQASRTPG